MSAFAATAPSARAHPAAPARPFFAGWAVALMVVAGVAAYWNSLGGAFVYDDRPSILNNPTIQQGWLAALQPPAGGETVTGRPLANLTFALNYAWSGDQAWSYHVVNVVIHVLAGLALFGLVRRTLELPELRARFAGEAGPVALAAALLWVLHPLQTDAVTYLAQRVESLMGLFYLLTLYCLVRALGARVGGYWLAGSVVACLLGMLCKEVMATAPLMAWLFDRTFGAGSFAAAWRRRAQYYAALAATWIPLAGLVWGAGDRGGSAGFHAGLAWSDYAWTQFSAITHYLSLAGWPHPQLVDYGSAWAASGGLAAAAFIAVLVAGTVWLLWRRPWLGFLGAWFFVILGPSSSVIPIVTEIAAEHRMYLPLAAVAVLAVLSLRAGCGRRWRWAAGALALALGALTHERNRDYQSGLDLWRETVANHPASASAHENYGIMLADAGRLRESAQEYETALRLQPLYPQCEYDLGNALGRLGQDEAAAAHYARAILGLRQDREKAAACFNRGNVERELALRAADPTHDPHWPEAVAGYQQALQLRPDDVEACYNLAAMLAQAGRPDDAINYYLRALQRQPVFAQVEANLGNAYVQAGRPDAAIPHYEQAIKEAPANPLAHYRLGLALSALGQNEAAVKEGVVAVQLAPNAPEVHASLGAALASVGRLDDAARELQAALNLQPDNAQVRQELDEVKRRAAAPAAGPAAP